MSVSLETQQRIAELRLKAQAGNLTREECQEAIMFLRQERALMPPAKAAGSRAKAPVNVDSLLGELGI